MSLTKNALPSIVPYYTVPVDANMQFASAQTLTATGYVNNANAVLDLGLGRFTGKMALDVTALDETTGDETYKIFLFGSNDNTFGNGNVENLGCYDYGASANRIVATILGNNTTVPPSGLGGALDVLFFTNLRQGIVYRYLKCYAVLAGTTPSITLSAWVSPLEMKV
jgi:hypothetical protein